MIYPTTTCRWCNVPLQWTSRYDFIMYAFKYFQTENSIPLERMSRVFYKIRSGARRNVCTACYRMDVNKIHKRELTGRWKYTNHKGPDITELVGIFMFKLLNQSWRHKRYVEFMWFNDHTFDAFLDYLHVRDMIIGNESGDIFDNEELEYYYEDMVRSHFQVPNHFITKWDDGENIISFQLNDIDVITVNAHPVVE